MVNVTNITTAPPRVTPSVSQPIRVDWGSWLAQILDHEEHIIGMAVAGGVGLALKTVPLGAIVSTFIGPKLIEQYVVQALDTLEGVLVPMGTDIPTDNKWVAAVIAMINKNEPNLGAFLEGKLEPLVRQALAKFGIAV